MPLTCDLPFLSEMPSLQNLVAVLHMHPYIQAQNLNQKAFTL